jgi:hypothetical protein
MVYQFISGKCGKEIGIGQRPWKPIFRVLAGRLKGFRDGFLYTCIFPSVTRFRERENRITSLQRRNS